MIERQRARLTGLYHDYPRPFWIVVVVTFIDRLGGALLFPFFALYITSRFDVGMTEVGMLFVLFSISGFTGAVLGGALTDRFGRKAMVVLSLVATSVSSLAMGLVDSLQAFYVLALVVGIFTDSGGPAYDAMIADLLPEQKRAEGYGLLRVGFNLAVVIGPTIGGLLASRSYLLLFVADAIISLVAASIVIVSVPETRPERRVDAPPETLLGTFRGYTRVLRDRVFLLFMGACLLMGLVYMNMNTTLGVYLRDTMGVPEVGYGMILGLNAIMVVLLQFPVTRRIEGQPPMLMMALGTLLYAIGFALYGFVTAYALFLVGMVIITFGEMIVAPVAQAVTATMAPPDMRGRYMAMFGFAWGIPYAIGPLLAGMIMDSGDPRRLWYAAGMVGLLAVAGFLLLNRRSIGTSRVPQELAAK